jgi:X-Pro dipeptidyl-peptidase
VVLAAVLAALAAVLTAPGAAHAAGPASAGTVRHGLSQPDYSYADAIREAVWVDTGLDGDGDGRADRVAVDIVRPSEPAKAGRKVPVIMDASPYYSCCGRGNEGQIKTYDAAGNIVQAPLFYDNYFVPRGYATVLVDLAGTDRSDGCVDIGGPSDIGSAKAVVDWLNGRAKGYSARSGGTPVTASWTTGDVGMIGKSWDGTIANGVAATGVHGLKTIVPISAISSWYDYYFHQGAPLQDGPEWLSDLVENDSAHADCAAEQQKIMDGSPRSGDWTPFWTARDYVKDAGKVRASVFAVQGMQDLNVRTKHFGQWWTALAAQGVERKVWLSQTGHVDPFDYRRSAWVPTLQRWFDHYLLGVDNGIQREPMADIERSVDHWTTDPVWPAPGTRDTALTLGPTGTAGLGTLGAHGHTAAGATESFTDDPNLWEEDWAAAADTATPAKTVFTTGVLAKDLRVSGGGTVTVTATSSTTSAHLSAVLVDLGPATIRDFLGAGEGIVTGSTRSCYGESTAGDSACFLDTSADTETVDHTVFSRGWADLGHYASLDHGVALTPGRPYTMTIQLAATDHVVPAGHRLALIVAGTDGGLILPPDTTPTVSVDLSRSVLRLPLTGGAAALRTRPGTPAADAARTPAAERAAAPRPVFTPAADLG